ncbi:beta-fructosidase [Candidatus Uabimicrobium amorphum]|uniref:Glycosyhydrolase n=1 Tax=Uabimicrobium amorphum TaxID=2596890 RepID=A0A5S9IN21_UABAM|nr:beta-fructosidase [Candidatus Uabimicrobium amorphum]BBM84352.1 glycosyhydrolase [Candidatus Uabimicrobium amorphum]
MNNYSVLQHPSRHVWDFWYTYDEKQKLFHVFYLNAPSQLVADNQHHFSSCVGYATTRDFETMHWKKYDVFCADKKGWDNTSIWTGDIIRIANGFLLFYTSRDQKIHDGLTQQIGMAYSTNIHEWQRVDTLCLQADNTYYEEKSLREEQTIHAWRDPYVFQHNNNTYMLVTAKSKHSALNRKGTVALLRMKDSLSEWEILPPLYAPNLYSECEVPRIYYNRDKLYLTFSCAAKYDFSSADNKGGLYAVELSNLTETSTKIAECILSEKQLYAAMILPELQGDIVGFHPKGGLQRKHFTCNWQHINRNFSHINL